MPGCRQVVVQALAHHTAPRLYGQAARDNPPLVPIVIPHDWLIRRSPDSVVSHDGQPRVLPLSDGEREEGLAEDRQAERRQKGDRQRRAARLDLDLDYIRSMPRSSRNWRPCATRWRPGRWTTKTRTGSWRPPQPLAEPSLAIFRSMGPPEALLFHK